MSRYPLPRISYWLRNFLAGREINPPERYADLSSPRTYPPADIPGGPAHRLNKNYYCDRDLRRGMRPPRPITARALPETTGEGNVPVTQYTPWYAAQSSSSGTTAA